MIDSGSCISLCEPLLPLWSGDGKLTDGRLANILQKDMAGPSHHWWGLVDCYPSSVKWGGGGQPPITQIGKPLGRTVLKSSKWPRGSVACLTKSLQSCPTGSSACQDAQMGTKRSSS